MKIAFIWQGFDGRYKYAWRDGLYAAMQLIEKEHEVKYFDFPLQSMEEFNPDVVLYWESPLTLKGENARNYQSVLDLPYKKALLFAGGPVKQDLCYGFDLYFVESKINEEEFQALGLPWKRAFGVNTQIMKPMQLEKKWDGILHATFAGWKRHELFADALGDKGLAVGRVQDSDRNGYNRCVERGVEVVDEQVPEELAKLINQSHVVVNTAEYWGGGQRCTLEAMACGIPVIVMSDSPKNMEYVVESGAGYGCDPRVEEIQRRIQAIVEVQSLAKQIGQEGVAYVQSKWTERHYADALLEGINSIV
jgi:glycosyltransferase involved in cell wall biosynthesis